jgi:hypothetical protein
MVPGKFEIHDYNYRMPMTAIEAERGVEAGTPQALAANTRSVWHTIIRPDFKASEVCSKSWC